MHTFIPGHTPTPDQAGHMDDRTGRDQECKGLPHNLRKDQTMVSPAITDANFSINHRDPEDLVPQLAVWRILVRDIEARSFWKNYLSHAQVLED